MGKYFGTDGIRGEAFTKLNSELAFKVGQGIVHAYHPKRVVIGMDTRISSPMLAHSIANGIMSLGVDVYFAGVVSTPMIAYYAHLMSMIGVMITASHNPFHDNGIKVFKEGYKSLPEDESKIEAFIDSGELQFKSFGSFVICGDVNEKYLKLIHHLDLPKSNLKIVYDSANGANCEISHELLSSYAPNSKQINHMPDGLNINQRCGSTHPESLIEKVLTEHADIGFAFDGDGDRLIVIDSHGNIIDGDQIIYVIAKYLKEKKLLNKNTVVLTKMSNPGILKALQNHDISYELTDVGDKYVFDALFSNQYTIGGESSGHVILSHLLHTGDGLLVAMYLLKILAEQHASLSELLADVTLFPLKLINIKDIDKNILNRETIKFKIDSIKQKLGDPSLLLVRPSGTENLIRVTVSFENASLVESVSDELVSFIKKEGEHK